MHHDLVASLVMIHVLVGLTVAVYHWIEVGIGGDRAFALGVLWPLAVVYTLLRGTWRLLRDAKNNWR